MEQTLKIRLRGDYETRKVYVDEVRVDPDYSRTIVNHSPDGFNWGYAGSGPSQLALAVMLRVFSKKKAVERYQEFKNKVIALLPKSDFSVIVDVDKFEIVKP